MNKAGLLGAGFSGREEGRPPTPGPGFMAFCVLVAPYCRVFFPNP
jgi:hypothetical protein